MKRIGVWLMALCLCSQVVWADDAPVGVQGEFQQIDTRQQDLTIKAVLKEKGPAIGRVLDTPGNYNPTVLYALAWQLFRQGHSKTALFWNYAAQLRALQDAAKSGDDTARQVIPTLNQKFVGRIVDYGRAHLDEATSQMEQVVEWDEKTEHNYDPRWIALQGVDAFYKSKIAFAPKSDWAEIDAGVRSQFVQKMQAQLKAKVPNTQGEK